MLESPNQTRYIGGFLKDRKHGEAQITKADGSQSRELWKEGELEKSSRIVSELREGGMNGEKGGIEINGR